MPEKDFHSKIVAIQTAFKAPKDRTISTGKFTFKSRSAEGILEKLKPFLKEHDLAFSASDQMIEIGDRIFDRSIVQLTDGDKVWQAQADCEILEASQNTSQLSGSTISYARKYALGGLLGIDDGNDADDEKHARQQTTSKSQPTDRLPDNHLCSTDEVGKLSKRRKTKGLSKEQSIEVGKWLQSKGWTFGNWNPIEKQFANHYIPLASVKEIESYIDHLAQKSDISEYSEEPF